MKKKFHILGLLLVLIFPSCKEEAPKADPGTLQLSSLRAGTVDISPSGSSINIPVDKPIVLTFSSILNTANAAEAITLQKEGQTIATILSFLDGNKTVSLQSAQALENNKEYTLLISEKLEGEAGQKFPGLTIPFTTEAGKLEITSLSIGDQLISGNSRIQNIPLEPLIAIEFSRPVDPLQITNETIGITGASNPTLNFQLTNSNQKLTITTSQALHHLAKYTLILSRTLEGVEGEAFSGFSKDFYTAPDPDPKFPLISDDELLTLVQQQTFNYFWDFAQVNSGMARERNTSGELVTSGGSGFGLMAIIVGIERNFISREEGLQRLDKILTFLKQADRFHGAWSHWINGNTGKVIPFSANDNGGDLVETSFLVQGLLGFRQYLNPDVVVEKALIDRINELWHAVEWDWYTRGGQNVLYWHWSPDKEWAMNHPIRGYNESLITYVLAAASPTHTIAPEVYHEGWAGNGAIKNGRSFYGKALPLGYDYGGPLFFAHYSFLGLDPRNLSDTYAHYWEQNRNHTLINREHAILNPNNFVGYSQQNWGFTASDNHQGYSAHSPTNDLGVITPTAALSSFPYTPEESMEALKFFYYTVGDKLWGPYGFYDAFNPTHGWVADSYLAIDQGPIVVMIENHRTALLWDLFMSAPEIQQGLNKLGFTY